MRVSLPVFLFNLLGMAVLANDGAVTGVGGTIKLMDEHPEIALVAEQVHARLSFPEGTVEVECLFVLTNNGPADTVQIGFPEQYGGDTGPSPFLFFESTVDGEDVLCARQPGTQREYHPQEFWWTKEVFFAAGQTRLICDVYRAAAGHSIGDELGDYRFFEYILVTGASWAGSIASGIITFSVEGDDGDWNPVKFMPAPDLVRDREFVWRFQDFEPGQTGPRYIHAVWRSPDPKP